MPFLVPGNLIFLWICSILKSKPRYLSSSWYSLTPTTPGPQVFVPEDKADVFPRVLPLLVSIKRVFVKRGPVYLDKSTEELEVLEEQYSVVMWKFELIFFLSVNIQKHGKRIEHLNRQKQTHRHGEQTPGCQGGEEGSGMDGEFGVSRCKLWHLE